MYFFYHSSLSTRFSSFEKIGFKIDDDETNGGVDKNVELPPLPKLNDFVGIVVNAGAVDGLSVAFDETIYPLIFEENWDVGINLPPSAIGPWLTNSIPPVLFCTKCNVPGPALKHKNIPG